ncbi:DUF1543 domain-containing protein [Aliidiomarina soli]|nr:DUF1543 domain-containing protein [Aliidiomarina soli]
MTQKLFMVYLGGSAPGANIELHDIRFVIATTIEQSYPELKRQWFGDKKSVHMDSYLHVHHVDGYRVELSEQPVAQSRRLYFVNFGGYFPGQMAEFHDFTLVVAGSPVEAKALAKAKVINAGLAGAEQLHKDDLLAVDDCLTLDLIDGYYIDLQHDGESQPLEPDWMGYQPLP